MKYIWPFLFVIPCLFSNPILASKGKPISLQFEFSRAGKTVCKETKQVQNEETFLFCEGKSLRNRALIKVKAKIIPYIPPEGYKDPKDQVDVSAVVEEIEPSGRVAIIMAPQITALDGEQAVISISETPEKGKIKESFTMKVTPIILN